MLEISLNKEYKITGIDDNNIILYRRSNKVPKQLLKEGMDEDKEPGWTILGYYINLECLYEDLIDRDINFTDAKTFKEVLDYLYRLKDAIHVADTDLKGCQCKSISLAP